MKKNSSSNPPFLATAGGLMWLANLEQCRAVAAGLILWRENTFNLEYQAKKKLVHPLNAQVLWLF